MDDTLKTTDTLTEYMENSLCSFFPELFICDVSRSCLYFSKLDFFGFWTVCRIKQVFVGMFLESCQLYGHFKGVVRSAVALF